MFISPVGISKRTLATIFGAALLVGTGCCLGLMIHRQGLMPERVRAGLTPYAQMITAAAGAGAKDRALERIFNSLKSNPQILQADLIAADGVAVAHYPPGSGPPARAVWNRPDGLYLGSESADLVQGVQWDGRPGHLVLRMSLHELNRREQQVVTGIFLAVMLALAELTDFILAAHRHPARVIAILHGAFCDGHQLR